MVLVVGPLCNARRLLNSTHTPPAYETNRHKIMQKGGVCVAVLCYDGKEGLSFYDVAKECHRVTHAELKEMYELSLVRIALDRPLN